MSNDKHMLAEEKLEEQKESYHEHDQKSMENLKEEVIHHEKDIQIQTQGDQKKIQEYNNPKTVQTESIQNENHKEVINDTGQERLDDEKEDKFDKEDQEAVLKEQQDLVSKMRDVRMEFLTKPQIILHSEKSVNYSIYECQWIPCSAKFVILGCKPKGTGIIEIYELSDGNCKLIHEVEKESSFKCATFGASSLKERYMATGNFLGRLEVWDIEDWKKPIFSAEAHDQIINCIDGFGGQSVGCGAPEIVTGSRDGSVKVWDRRQRGRPVAVIEPEEGDDKRDCWCVTIGNSYNNHERVICAGYDNGDIKMFDLKKMGLRWETNVKNGVCCLEFDRKDIEMNKLVATTLESRIFIFDVRVQHRKRGYGHLTEKAHTSTVWFARHLPQNREIFMTGGGNGSLCLWKYCYPERRVKEDGDGEKYSVAGKLDLLQNTVLTTQPISSFHWNRDKQGLAVATSFDQTFRVLLCTNLKLV